MTCPWVSISALRLCPWFFAPQTFEEKRITHPKTFAVPAIACALAGSIFSVSGWAACADPWVTKAVKQVTGRDAQGSGNSGQCNISLYGGGHWSNYNDLVGKVTVALRPAPPVAAQKPPAPVLSNPKNAIGTAGGGNIVASGGGNIVASGGGNLKQGAAGGKIISTNGAGVKNGN